ncbi:hypothetical protein CALCODRAFT_481300 [Calocera cornea HHB12733]|uniref:Ribosome biogenesis protein NSA1 n=1 Tax=Calocera cornea HHB12733 TaxID=1353952 RepID=A0A165HVF6_9BASI|nr:hypothetical protein CALCODRAFT_481300 [Calocera cornea HHB12733]
MASTRTRTLRFWTGDEQGRLKSLTCAQEGGNWSVNATTVPAAGSSNAVQKLSLLRREEGDDLLAVARADGTLSLLRTSYSPAGEASAAALLDTTEPRFRPSAQFVGLSVRESGVYSCTSSGHLRRTPLPASSSSSAPESSGPEQDPEAQLAALPQRLRAMQLSPSGRTLAYGGDEVSASVWSVERAFARKSGAEAPDGAGAGAGEGKKRKKSKELFAGELWRARNEPNDALDLRVPVQITALAHLAPSDTQLVTGSEDGSLRLYDTRAGRKPQGHWRAPFKRPVRVVEPGGEHQLFAADAAGTLASVDTRTGRCMYTYRGLTSALTALAPVPTSGQPLLAAVGRDRTFRLSSAPPPPGDAKANAGQRGEELVRLWMPSVPLALVFAGFGEAGAGAVGGPGPAGRDGDGKGGGDGEGDGEVWEGMQEVGSDDDDDGGDDGEPEERKKRRRV